MKNSVLKGFLSICFVFYLTSPGLHAQEAVEKGTLLLDLTFHQTNDEIPVLKALTRTKIEKKFRPVKGVNVNFFIGEESEAGFLGRMRSNEEGVGLIEIPAQFKDRLNADSTYYFIATVTEDEKFEDTSSEIEIFKAKIEVTYAEDGEEKSVSGKLLALGDSGWVEVPAVEMKFVVDRYFQDLSITEDYLETDEFGEASADFLITIPGDENGNINVGAKIEDHELYGSLTFSEAKQWGTPLILDDSFAERTLWATRDKTPVWLLVIANIIIISVWSVIFYLAYQLILMRRIGKAQ